MNISDNKYEILYEKNFILIKRFVKERELPYFLEMGEFKENIKYLSFSRYKMTKIFNKFVTTIRNQFEPAHYCNKLVNIFMPLYENSDLVNLLGFKYLNSKSSKKITLHKHYDTFTSWNMIASKGGSTMLCFGKSSYVIENGDVYIFNGNMKYHSVEKIDDTDRICFQYKIQPCKGDKFNKYYTNHLMMRYKLSKLYRRYVKKHEEYKKMSDKLSRGESVKTKLYKAKRNYIKSLKQYSTSKKNIKRYEVRFW